ncbi:MAG: ROK family protein [Tenacibaculum sp.]
MFKPIYHLIEVTRKDSYNVVLRKVFKAIDALITNSVSAIGIGVPSVVDPNSGTVYNVQNIPAWKKVPLKKLIQTHYKVTVSINNDANCLALGEKYFGRGKEYKNYVVLCLGTGLGMGILIDNKLYNGVMCGAGEVGMLPYKDGVIEHYTGSFFFDKKYGESAKSLYEKAIKKDRLALHAFKEYGIHLGEAIKVIMYLYAPQAIILSGSISNAYAFFEESIQEILGSYTYQKQLKYTKIEKSDLINASTLGAIALCM